MIISTGHPLNNVMFDLKMNDEGRISIIYITCVHITHNNVAIAHHDDCILLILLLGDCILFDLKQLNPLINLPYLIDGDVIVSQSNACFTYLGRKFDMLGKYEHCK